MTFNNENTTRFEIEEEIKNRVKCIRVYCKPGLFKWLIKWRGFKRGLTHLKYSGNFDFDIIHHNVIWKDAWQALTLRRWWNKPVVITEHWTGYDPARKNEQPLLLRPFARWVASKATVICPVSKDLENKMIDFGLRSKFIVVPNVVDTHLFYPGHKDMVKKRFLHISHLIDSHKNISGILRTWKKVSDFNKQIHLQIGGDGDYQKWEIEAHKLQIDPETISFFGEQSSSTIAGMMSQGHCLLLFSHYENLPVVIVEALASGMFVISTDVGGISEHINQDRGILVQDNDEQALQKAIETVASHDFLLQTEALRKYAVDHFSELAVANMFSEVYDQIR